MVPKLSAPLVKDIRTGEGVAEWLLAIVIAVLTAVGDLGVVKGATFILILAGIKGARRGLIKLVAVLNPKLGIGPPETPQVLDELGLTVEAILSEIDDSNKQTAAAQNALGTPEGDLKNGLAPDAEPPPPTEVVPEVKT